MGLNPVLGWAQWAQPEDACQQLQGDLIHEAAGESTRSVQAHWLLGCLGCSDNCGGM